ncbi:MAG: hypothetical protein ACLT8E_01585 [Akkermansia sp.]
MNISRTLTATLAAAFTLPARADIPASRVPAPVKEQVQKQYPNAGAIEWDFDNDEDVYEADSTSTAWNTTSSFIRTAPSA